jgi:Xaa-Pro aminopeptidase
VKKMEQTGRKKAQELQQAMAEKGIGFLVLSQAKSFYHLIFSRIPFICILGVTGDPWIFTHYDSVDLVRKQSWCANIKGIYPYKIGIDKKDDVEKDYLSETVEYIRSFKDVPKKIALDLGNTPVNTFRYFKERLNDYGFEDFSSSLNSVFSINTAEEIENIKKAAVAAEEGAVKAREYLMGQETGITENQLAAYAEYQMRKRSVDGFFVPSSVASGERTCLIGAADSERVIRPGDIVNVDHSPVYQGYFADICRPISKKPFSRMVMDRCRIIEEALDIAIDSIRPGIEASSVDRKVREHFKACGHDGKFIHHTGHPVGNSWGIMITSNSHAVIEEGMAFALEPGLYDREAGGLRIEDNVYVTKNGAVNLMSLPRIL